MGKKSPAPPPAPDYAAAAQQQGQANLEAARLTARLSNPNISTPLGGQRVTFGRDVFNQQAYDKAMADYNKQLEAYNAAKASGQPYAPPPSGRPTGLPTGMPGGAIMGGRFERDDFARAAVEPGGEPVYSDYSAGGGLRYDPTSGAPVAPTREQFTTRTDLDTPFIEQYLTPEAQATLEAQQRVEKALAGLGEQAIGTVRDVYGQKFTPTGLPEQQFGFGGYGEVPTAPNLGQFGRFRGGFDVEAMPNAPDLMGMGRAGADVTQQNIDFGPSAGLYGFAGAGPTAPSQIVGANLGGLGGVSYGPVEGQYGFARGYGAVPQLQERVDVRDLAALPAELGLTGQSAILSRLSPTLTAERNALENRLRNQGLTPGTEAYNREMELFNQKANDLLQQTAAEGLRMDAAMRAQGFNERQIQNEIANRAREASFGMRAQQTESFNRAVEQNLRQGLSLSEATNRAQEQDFRQRLAAGQFGREGQQLAFTMGQSAQDMYNRAVEQNFAQGMSATEARNRAAEQVFQQQTAIQELRNRALMQNQATALQDFEARMGRQRELFGQGMSMAGLYNEAIAAERQSELQRAQAEAALQAQRFNQARAGAEFTNAARAAGLQEQLALRQLPLNEIAAIMSGAQVQLPQFQGYQGADVAAAPIFGATTAAGDFAQKNYQNQVAGYNARMGMYGNLAGALGTAAGGGFFGNPFSKPPVPGVT